MYPKQLKATFGFPTKGDYLRAKKFFTSEKSPFIMETDDDEKKMYRVFSDVEEMRVAIFGILIKMLPFNGEVVEPEEDPDEAARTAWAERMMQ